MLLKKEKISVEYKDGNYWIDLSQYIWKTPNFKCQTKSKIQMTKQFTI